jgi:hypothetical protein
MLLHLSIRPAQEAVGDPAYLPSCISPGDKFQCIHPCMEKFGTLFRAAILFTEYKVLMEFLESN